MVPAAVLAGLLLFLVTWLAQRPAPEEEQETVVLPSVAAEPASALTPLPAPQRPELADGAQAPASEEQDAGVFVLPEAPTQPLPTVAGQPAPATPAGADAAAAGQHAGAPDSQPVPVHRPSPVYPGRALRRGETGTVVVRVRVGIDGRPRQLEIARSSSHRALDRAALQAMRDWRFQPAMRGGQPVEDTVQVPFDFNP